MFVPRIRAAAACLCVAAVVIVAGTASAEQEFTPVAVGVRYRKIGVFDEARLAAILDRGLDAFMAGFDPSQGGWSTMQFLRRLETLDIPVTAAATVSAPVDLTAAFRRPITSPRPQDAAWIIGKLLRRLIAAARLARASTGWPRR